MHFPHFQWALCLLDGFRGTLPLGGLQAFNLLEGISDVPYTGHFALCSEALCLFAGFQLSWGGCSNLCISAWLESLA